MKRSNRQQFFVVIIALLAIVIGVGCAIWNRPHAKAENQATTVVDVNKLYTEFTTNEQAANTTYLNKVIQVSGTATEISRNQDGYTVVVIEVADPLGGVQCTMREKEVSIAPNSAVTLKGFCHGFTSVVLLSDCVAAN